MKIYNCVYAPNKDTKQDSTVDTNTEHLTSSANVNANANVLYDVILKTLYPLYIKKKLYKCCSSHMKAH